MKCSLIPILTLLIVSFHFTINVGGKGEAVTIQRHSMSIPIFYGYGGGWSRLRHDVDMAVLLEDLKPGHKIKMDFTQCSNQTSFLPRELADSIPFSSAKLDDILKRLGIKPGSEDAEIVKQTLMDCEAAGMKGEEKYCATSWESMVDFGTSKLGEKVEAVFMEAAAAKERGTQEYTIGGGVEKVWEKNMVMCHIIDYPYAVFYCHTLEKTTVYTVPLEGSDGMRLKAVVVCHADTSHWNPKLPILQVLNVKPGTVPVCHFLPPHDNIVWVPKRLQIL